MATNTKFPPLKAYANGKNGEMLQREARVRTLRRQLALESKRLDKTRAQARASARDLKDYNEAGACVDTNHEVHSLHGNTENSAYLVAVTRLFMSRGVTDRYVLQQFAECVNPIVFEDDRCLEHTSNPMSVARCISHMYDTFDYHPGTSFATSAFLYGHSVENFVYELPTFLYVAARDVCIPFSLNDCFELRLADLRLVRPFMCHFVESAQANLKFLAFPTVEDLMPDLSRYPTAYRALYLKFLQLLCDSSSSFMTANGFTSVNKYMHSIHGNSDYHAQKVDGMKKRRDAAQDKARVHQAQRAGGSTKKTAGRMEKEATLDKARGKSAAEPAKSKKGTQKMASEAAASVLAAMQDAVAKESGSKDAHEEVFSGNKAIAERRLVHLVHTREEDDAWQGLRTNLSEFVDDNGHGKFFAIWTDPSEQVGDWLSMFRSMVSNVICDGFQTCRQAAKDQSDLRCPPFPHVVVEFSFDRSALRAAYDMEEEISVTEGSPPDGAYAAGPVMRNLPSMERFAAQTRVDIVLDLTVTFHTYGFLWERVKSYQARATTPLLYSTLVAAHLQHRCIGVSFDADFETMEPFLGRMHDSVLFNKYDTNAGGWFNTFASTALLHVLNRPPACVRAGFFEYEVARRAIYAGLIGARPAPGGTYFTGYECQLKDIFPQALRDGVEGMLDASAGIIFSTRGTVDLAAKAAKQALSYACATPARIEGIFGTFPAPENATNLLLGMTKRLGLAHKPQDTDVIDTIFGIFSQVIEDRLRGNPAHFTTDHDLEQMCEKHAKAKGFKGSSFADYMSGVRDCLNGVKISDQTRDQSGATDWTYSSKVFVKAETYPQDAIKAPRFIICPTLWMRGYTHCLLYDSQHNYFNALGTEHCVKEQTVDEMSQQLFEAFDHLEWFAETDYTSFESNINPVLILKEGQILTQCGAPARATQLADMFVFMSTHMTLAEGQNFKLILPPMRRSGEDHTSAGNNILNCAMTLYILLPLVYPALQNLTARSSQAVIQEWYVAFLEAFKGRFFMFEGDDGIMHVQYKPSDAALKGVEYRIEQLGVRLKFDFARRGQELNFCGNSVVSTVHSRPLQITDWLTKIANVTTTFQCIEGDSNAKVEEVAYGKACSYYYAYRHAPVLSVFCREAFSWYSQRLRFKKIHNAYVTLYAADFQFEDFLLLYAESGAGGVELSTRFELDAEQLKSLRVLEKFYTRVYPHLPYHLTQRPTAEFAEFVFGGVPPKESETLFMMTGPLLTNPRPDPKKEAYDALDASAREHGGIDANMARHMEHEIVQQFSEHAHEDAVKIVIPELSRLWSSCTASARMKVVELSDARQHAAKYASDLTTDLKRNRYLAAYGMAISHLLKFGARWRRAAAPGAVASLFWLWMCGYFALYSSALLAAVIAVVAFLLLLPLNGFSVRKAAPRALALMVYSPMLVAAWMIHEFVMLYYEGAMAAKAATSATSRVCSSTQWYLGRVLSSPKVLVSGGWRHLTHFWKRDRSRRLFLVRDLRNTQKAVWPIQLEDSQVRHLFDVLQMQGKSGITIEPVDEEKYWRALKSFHPGDDDVELGDFFQSQLLHPDQLSESDE